MRRTPFNIPRILNELAGFVSKADFLLGHHPLLHDLPLCLAVNPRLAFLNKPVIDTLFLSPLAFPETPRSQQHYRY